MTMMVSASDSSLARFPRLRGENPDDAKIGACIPTRMRLGVRDDVPCVDPSTVQEHRIVSSSPSSSSEHRASITEPSGDAVEPSAAGAPSGYTWTFSPRGSVLGQRVKYQPFDEVPNAGRPERSGRANRGGHLNASHSCRLPTT